MNYRTLLLIPASTMLIFTSCKERTGISSVSQKNQEINSVEVHSEPCCDTVVIIADSSTIEVNESDIAPDKMTLNQLTSIYTMLFNAWSGKTGLRKVKIGNS